MPIRYHYGAIKTGDVFMKFKRKVLVRNLVIAMVVADGAGIYWASQHINKPVTVDDAALEEIARAADTKAITFTPAPEQEAPALAAAPAPAAAPKLAQAEPTNAAPIAPAKPVASAPQVAKAGLDRFPAPAFGKVEAKPASAKVLAAAKPVQPAPRVIQATKPAKRALVPTLASASVKKPVTLSTITTPQGKAVMKRIAPVHHDNFAQTFASLGTPSVQTSVTTGTAGLVTAPEMPSVAMQMAPEQSAPIASAAPVATAAAPEIMAQPTTPTASVAELPAIDGKS